METQWKSSGSPAEVQWKPSGSPVETQWKSSGVAGFAGRIPPDKFLTAATAVISAKWRGSFI
ncbi:hypothetical protein DQG13_26895 [Paenibacillus sp. YN15]|nr:hypothetical protein DQG13_26895 [Paenibacillus sp. YN15]